MTDEADLVYVIVTVKKLATKERHKPYRIPLRVPLYDETKSVCLIIKNSEEEHVEELENMGIPQIKQVVTMNQLKTEFKPYQARRLLMADHDLFLTDDRIIPYLPQLLGVKFFKAKKLPSPVNLLADDMEQELKKALSCTYFRTSKGTCNSFKVGTTEMSAVHLADNIMTAMEVVPKCIPSGWENILSIGIKTGNSLTLPIYNSLPTAATAINSNATATVAKDCVDSSDNTASDQQQEPSKDEKEQAKIDMLKRAMRKSKKSHLSRTKVSNN